MGYIEKQVNVYVADSLKQMIFFNNPNPTNNSHQPLRLILATLFPTN